MTEHGKVKLDQYHDILVEVEDHVATVTLNRPQRLNAFTPRMLDELNDAFTHLGLSREVRVVVMTGAGRAFCSGGDVDEMGQPESAVERKEILARQIQGVPKAMAKVDQPIIARINGDAVGGGLDMALMCDIRIASERARLSEGYVRLGLVPGDGGAFHLPRLMGLGNALEFLLTGDFITADQAAEMGVVNRTVPHADLTDAVRKLSRRIASLPPTAVQLTKRLTYESLRLDFSTALDLASSHVVVVSQSEDHREAVLAFKEGRRGKYSGR